MFLLAFYSLTWLSVRLLSYGFAFCNFLNVIICLSVDLGGVMVAPDLTVAQGEAATDGQNLLLVCVNFA